MKMKQQTQMNKIEWREVELGSKDYFEIISSGIREFAKEKDYLSTESVQGTKIEKVECKITYQDRPSRANMQPVLNSTWFAKMKSTVKVYSFSNKNKEDIDKYILSTGFAGVKFWEDVSSDYVKLFFLTRRFNEEKDKLSTGSTQSGINNSFISRIKIPLPFSNNKPDLKEQERIVRILEKAEKLKERGKNAEELLDEYLKSVFNEMFYNKGFPIEKLENVVSPEKNSLKRGPFGGSLKKDIFVKEGFKVYEQQNAIYKNMKRGEYYITSQKYKEMIDFSVKPGDFIISCSGTMGKIALIPEGSPQGVINQALLKITLDNTKIANSYFKFLFENEQIQNHLFNVSHGSGISNFPPMSFIRNLEVLLPPLPLQQKFAKIVEQVEKMKENIKKTKTNSEELFNSLMQKAFRGELVR